MHAKNNDTLPTETNVRSIFSVFSCSPSRFIRVDSYKLSYNSNYGFYWFFDYF